jgi:allantoate deiminase
MQAAGMRCRMDAAGNLIGRWEDEHQPAEAVLIIGSHLDTVPDGGRYDGMLGVLLGVALVEAISRTEAKYPFAIEIVGFSEEEGVRYAAPYIGSKAMAGRFDRELLDRVDDQGITLADALRAFGGSPQSIDSAAVDPARVVAYLEAHLEQGPVLQDEGLPLAAVSAIAGQTRLEVRLAGGGGHAGTTPMNLRRDALTAAAEWILQVEDFARESIGMVATVGVVEVSPNVSNVIPGEVRLRLDLRHADDADRSRAVAELCRMGLELGARRHVSFEPRTLHVQDAALMDTAMTRMLQESVADAGVRPLTLISGAGHDAAVMAGHCPSGMLFVRCRDGVSHHPNESVECADVVLALTAMWHFVRRLALRTGARADVTGR